MKTLIAASALLLSANALAECPAMTPWPETERPAIPDGATASYEEMQAAGAAVQDYVATIENYLECEPQRVLLRHDHLVDLAGDAARLYNAERESFFAAQAEMVAGSN